MWVLASNSSSKFQAKTPEEKAAKKEMVSNVIHGHVEGRIIDEGVQEMEDEDLSDEEDMYSKIPKVSYLHVFLHVQKSHSFKLILCEKF